MVGPSPQGDGRYVDIVCFSGDVSSALRHRVASNRQTAGSFLVFNVEHLIIVDCCVGTSFQAQEVEAVSHARATTMGRLSVRIRPLVHLNPSFQDETVQLNISSPPPWSGILLLRLLLRLLLPLIETETFALGEPSRNRPAPQLGAVHPQRRPLQGPCPDEQGKLGIRLETARRWFLLSTDRLCHTTAVPVLLCNYISRLFPGNRRLDDLFDSAC